MDTKLKEFLQTNPKTNFMQTPEWAAVKTEWKKGDTLIQIDLANTLKRIRDHGQAGFYEGETARLIVAEMKRGNGIITLEDLKNYKAKERVPHSFNYKEYKKYMPTALKYWGFRACK